MPNAITNFLTPYEEKTNIYKNYIKIALISAIIATAVFLPLVILDKGIMLIYGDYNCQQIPFYKLAHDAIRNGNLGINWTTDLGSNFIASYSFYVLGSPFFWLTIPFPNSFLPYLMAPLFVLKFATASLTSYIFIRRFTSTNKAAFLGALLYSFSGFSIYNIFFNHFHEVIAFFPVLLIGFENLITNKKKGMFALAVAINLIINYYFFVPEIVFLFIYAIFRCFTKNFKINIKTFGLIVLEGTLGFMMGIILFIPSALMVLQNPRISSTLLGYDIILYDNQTFSVLLHSLFFPPDMPSLQNFFPKSNFFPYIMTEWSSTSAYMPIFGMTGVIAFLKNVKNNWLKRLLITLLIFAFVPFLNSAFNGFNYTFYTRWFFGLTLILAICTVIAIEKYRNDLKFAVKINLLVIAAFSIIGILPKKVDEKIVFFNLPKFPVMFWINISIAFIGVLIVIIFFVKKQKTPKKTYNRLIIIFMIFAAAYSLTEVSWGKAYYGTNDYKNIVIDGLNADFSVLKNDNKNFYRVEVFPETVTDNLTMFWKVPSVQAFQSTVPASIMHFYKNIGLKRDVKSEIPAGKYNGLRDFLSVKYIFFKKRFYENDKLIPPNFSFLKEENNFRIYKNNNFLPMGIALNSYIEESDFKKIKSLNKDELLKKAIIISKNQIEKYKDILTPYPEQEIENLCNKKENKTNEYIPKENYIKPKTCSEFKTNSYGFSAKVILNEEKLILFTVPYESGFSAKINGQKVDVEKVDYGLMAVKAKKGYNNIDFSYETPGLKQAIIISFIGVFIYLIYIAIIFKIKKKPI